MLADGFRDGITDETFGRGVPWCDDAVGGLAHDRIIRRRDDRG